MTVVFDLDGTLTLTDHRDHLAKARDWDAYHAACKDDAPNPPILLLHRQFDWSWNDIHIWTGRAESQRAVTLKWLDRCLPGMAHSLQQGLAELLMRPDDDHRPANVLKGEWLKAFRAKHDDRLPDLAVDDRLDCARWWRQQGVPCLDVAGHAF